jgi:hypothetical protein
MARKESRKTTTGGESKRGRASKAASELRSQPMMESEGGGTATATAPITHEQIAERARQIWEQHGRPQGEDERNWREAERQLRAEMEADQQ